MKYRALSQALREEFGQKVYKISLESGCTCPNRDGTIGTGGCSFCSAGGSGEFAQPPGDLQAQIEAAKALVDRKIPARIPRDQRRYIAYFQSYTNTYGDPDKLLRLYERVLSRPDICALSLGTRPDCVGEEIVRRLADLQQRMNKPVWVELGLQTIHERTARAIHRGYSLEVFEDAYARLRSAQLTVIVHLILGLPGESREDILDSVRYLAGLTPTLQGVKLQLLHVLRGTELARAYALHPFPLMTLEEYCDLVVECLRILPPETVIHRMTGDGPKRLLIAPLWSADKKRVRGALERAIREA